MIRLLKFLVILALIGGIAAGLAGAYYFLVEQPKRQDALELQAIQSGGPTPDPGKDDYERAFALKRDRKYAKAKEALETFLIHYPDSSHKADAEFLLGDINMSDLFSGAPGPNKVQYIVLPGDVLDRVARKMKSTPEMIFQANGLDRILLRIGQKLEIPQVEFTLDIHLGAKRLYVLNRGRFFKAYDILSEKPPSKKPIEIRTKISEKHAFNDGRLVAFGSKDYLGSTRSMLLDKQPIYTISGQSTAPAADPSPGETKPPAAPTGIILSSSDAEELDTLVKVGTPVTITSD